MRVVGGGGSWIARWWGWKATKGAWADGWRVNRTLAPRRRLREARPRAFAIERAPSPICPSTQPHPPFLCLSPTSPLSVTTLYTLPSLRVHPPASPLSPIVSLLPHTTTPLTLIHAVPNYGYVLRTYRCLHIYVHLYIHIYIYTYVYIYICTYIHIKAYIAPHVRLILVWRSLCTIYIHTYTYVHTSRLDAFVCGWIRAVVQLYFRMSWIYRAREVAEHEVYSLCHYRRFNEFQSLFRRQDNLIGRSGDSDTPPPPLAVCRTCVFEFFDRSENNGGATAFQSSPDNARLFILLPCLLR